MSKNSNETLKRILVDNILTKLNRIAEINKEIEELEKDLGNSNLKINHR